MSEVIENTILGLIKNNCNVRAWEKAEEMVSRVRKNRRRVIMKVQITDSITKNIVFQGEFNSKKDYEEISNRYPFNKYVWGGIN